MQETAITLIAKKLETALLVEGDLPEGLAEYGTSGESLVQELSKALTDGGSYGGAEKAWANFRKKEIETSLGLNGEQKIFSITGSKGIIDKGPVTNLKDNVMVKVTILNGKKKNRSIVEVKYGDLDAVSKGQSIQFALF
jgi:hypothetical protein